MSLITEDEVRTVIIGGFGALTWLTQRARSDAKEIRVLVNGKSERDAELIKQLTAQNAALIALLATHDIRVPADHLSPIVPPEKLQGVSISTGENVPDE